METMKVIFLVVFASLVMKIDAGQSALQPSADTSVSPEDITTQPTTSSSVQPTDANPSTTTANSLPTTDSKKSTSAGFTPVTSMTHSPPVTSETNSVQTSTSSSASKTSSTNSSSVKPQTGSTSVKPQTGSTSVKPQTGSTSKPQTGSTSVKPQTGSTSVKPQTGSTSVKPQTGSTSVKPQTGSTSVKPKTGSTSLKPKTGSTSVKPQTGSTSVKPQTGSTSVKPQTGSTSVKPQTGSTSVKPQTGSTSVKPQTGSTSVKPQTGSTSVKPKTGSTSVKPKTGSTSVKPKTGSTSVKPKTGSTSVKPKTGSTLSSTPITSKTGTSSVASKSTSPRPSSTTIKPSDHVLISEVNLLLANEDYFIELKGLSRDVHQNLSVVFFNGEDNTCLSHIKIDTSSSSDNGFGVFAVKDATAKHNAFAIALFDSTNWKNSPNECDILLNASGLMDVLIISKDLSILSSQITKTMAWNKQTHVMIVDLKRISTTGQNYSISRCASSVRDSGGFILSLPSKQAENKCKTTSGKKIQLKLTDAKCKDFQSDQAKRQLLDVLVLKVVEYCACGMSPLLFKLKKYHCGSLIFEAFLEASNPTLANEMFVFYNAFVKSAQVLIIGNKTYHIDSNCNNECLISENKGNIKVTIAVVTSCVVVFLLVVIAVVIYLRRKRRGVLQFRMTRLDEDDDDLINPEMDDFVSGGQGASFENRLYSRFDTK